MTSIGGQAIIEGVMIRNEDLVAIAIRTPEGNIITKKEKIKPLLGKKIKKVYLIRGAVNLAEMLIIGIKTLNYSANIAAGQKEEEKPVKTTHLVITLIAALALTLFIFKFIPLLLAQYFSKNITQNNYAFNLIEGGIKIIIFLGYLLAISRMKEIRKMFQYHGAEHKAVNCYEAKKEVNIENCKKYSTVHTRCGTSFIITVLIISIIVYMFIPKELSFIEKFAWRIILLPAIAGISYESIKLSSKYEKSITTRVMAIPGRLIQKITTQEPSEKQLEVAITALKEAIN